MYFIIFLTEHCNLECSYCETHASRSVRTQEIQYSIDQLVGFLRRDPNLSLQFYGGEPLLRLDLIEAILAGVAPAHVCVQTNGLLLDRIPEPVLAKIDVFSVSVDGSAEVTDAYRGRGVYNRVLAQVQALRQRGFTGRIDARMTTSPGVRIFDAVTHLADAQACAFSFDALYWQLNVLFGVEDWRFDRRFIKKWFKEVYRPEITRLIDHWVEALSSGRPLANIIPFCTTMHHILTGRPVEAIQCGAGHGSWTIVPTGEIYACPVLRCSPEYNIGTIASVEPAQIKPLPGLRGPCENCSTLGLCGGRCIYTSESMRWGEEGFALVCSGVKQMIKDLERVAPTVQALVDAGRVDLDAFALAGYDYEVIP